MSNSRNVAVWLRARIDRKLMACAAVIVTAMAFTASAGSDYIIYLVAGAFIAILFAETTGFMIGFAGLPNFGAQMMFGAAAYAAGTVAVRYGVHELVVPMLCGAAAAAILAVATSVFCRPGSTFVFGLVTLALGQAVYLFVEQSPYIYGDNGLPDISRGTFLGISVRTNYEFLWLSFVVLVAASAALWTFRRCRSGEVIRACRDSWQRAASLGISVWRYQVLALAVAGALTGVAGSMYAFWLQSVDPSIFIWTFGADAVLAALLGGVRTFWGPIVGAAVYQGLELGLNQETSAWEMYVAGLVLVIFLLAPSGLVGLWDRARVVAASFVDRRREGRSDGDLGGELKPAESMKSSS